MTNNGYIISKHDALIALGVIFAVILIAAIVCCFSCNRKVKKKNMACQHQKDIEAARDTTKRAVGPSGGNRELRTQPPIPLLTVRLGPKPGTVISLEPQDQPHFPTSTDHLKFPEPDLPKPGDRNPFRPYANDDSGKADDDDYDDGERSSLDKFELDDKPMADNPYAAPESPVHVNYCMPRSALRGETARLLTGRLGRSVTWDDAKGREPPPRKTGSTGGCRVEVETAKESYYNNNNNRSTGLPRLYRGDM